VGRLVITAARHTCKWSGPSSLT